MKEITTQKKRISRRFCGVLCVVVVMLCAVLPARAQYESFFGGESWEYATGFHPIMGTADHDPYLLRCMTNTYRFTRSNIVSINENIYYNSSATGLGAKPVKLREDTLFGRLYALIEGREFLLCDMSLEVGDTFYLPVLQYYNCEPVDTLLLHVDSVTFLNSKKNIHLSALSQELYYWWPFIEDPEEYEDAEEYCNITLRFMEGVGPMYGVLPPYKLGDVLLCLTKDDTLYYLTHPDLGCWQTVSAIPDLPEQTITIYPNPAIHRISIRFETEEEIQGDIVIRDIFGRVCLQTSVSTPIINLNIGNLSKGTYLITFRGRNNCKITKKFVKK